MQKHLHFQLLFDLSMPCKLDYALKTQKWKASCNCIAIYEGPFHTWWNTNYIAHMHKSKLKSKSKLKKKKLKRVKHGPNGLTLPYIAPRNR